MFRIYKIKNRITKKVYIGYTSKDVKRRWEEHQYVATLYKKKGEFTKFYNSVLKYGKKFWDVKVVEITDTRKRACLLEKKYIKKFNSFKCGYNSSLGGEGSFGYKWTEIQRKKASLNAYVRTEKHRKNLSDSMKKLHKQGFKFSKKHRQNLSLSQTGSKNHQYGKKHTIKFKKYLRKLNSGKNNKFYGRHHTKKTKDLIRKKLIGRYSGGNNPAAIRVKIGNIIYSNKRAAMRKLNLSYFDLQQKIKFNSYPGYSIVKKGE